MTTTYSDTSCNSENIVACSQLVARGCCMHVFLVGNNDSESLFINRENVDNVPPTGFEPATFGLEGRRLIY